MKLLDKLFGRSPEAKSRPRASAEGIAFQGLDDPALLEFIRNGQTTSANRMVRNMAALRSLSLISNGLGMLPISLYEAGSNKKVMREHQAHKLIRVKPNPWQTPMEFKSQMQLLLETEGNAYARIIRSGTRPIHLIPFEKGRVQAKLGSNYRMQYTCTTENGNQLTLDQEEILHIREISFDGVLGLSKRQLSEEVFELAASAQRAAVNVFKTGVMAGGSIEVQNALSDRAFDRMKQSLNDEYSGAENMAKWMILEEGAKANQFSSTAKDGQQIENRNHQIEEVARLYGVPRPLLMMDDTSWGSGIEQLAIFFVQFTMAPRFVCWEQALARSLLTDRERETLYFKTNERALLRGTLKDQADYFAKALGSGGHQPWHTANEIRDLAEYPADSDPKFNTLGDPSGKKASNEPQKAT
ncbi:phage portal protein [Comamonas sp. C11]|uniref:phage portal protein n=1 Tax=Comamonas sp. C11 TaxID=2966554 RepID=UPI002112910F|nr:phage portal protein [Comamonas sp. C11]UUC92470.1 phage portal protein [Comamonas sp. C11]UUC92522.1 phage portal protein [Comamonas sp. C11]